MGSYNWTRRENGEETFKALSEYLSKGKNPEDRPYSNNTRIQKTGLGISVVLHGTRVITFFPGGEFWLNSGGWKTVTTKARINEFIPKGWTVWQNKGIWYIGKANNGEYYPYDKMLFQDEIKLPKEFNPYKGKKELNRMNKLIKDIDLYCKKLKEKIKAHEIDDPGPGDCWFCLMRDITTGKPIGDRNTDHLFHHIKENYFVPSLIINAMEDAGYNVSFWWGMYKYDKENEKSCFNEADTFGRAVKRYLKKQLGIAR